MKYCPQCKADMAQRQLDGVERLACSSPGCKFVFWENPTPVTAGLVMHNGEFLLARNSQWPKGMYSLITGFMEKGEAPEETISREATEELGLAVDDIKFIGHYAFPQFNQLLIAYLVRASGDLAIGNEISEVKRLSKGELASYDFGPLEITAKIVGHALQMA